LLGKWQDSLAATFCGSSLSPSTLYSTLSTSEGPNHLGGELGLTAQACGSFQSAHAFTVIEIVSGGAAKGAGLPVNDSIRSVNGRSVSEIRLADLREKWVKGPDGTRITLGIKRGEVVQEKILQLKSLV
jgi:C-terminal processing protease CtpA/Prc